MSVGAVNKSTGDRIPAAGMTAIDAALSGSSTNPVQNRVVKAALDGKVDAESGKGLSENDYTNTDKAKVAASLNVFTGTQAEWAQLSTAEKKAYQRADFTDDYDPTAIGNMADLHTSTKSSIVGAINEVADGKQNSTDNNLQTTSKTIVGGINEVKSGLTNRFVNLITADAISVANTAKAGTTINKAQLRHDGRFAELIVIITNDNAFDTGDTGVMLNIDWSKTGVSFDEFKSACGTCNTSAEYPDFAHAGAISAWTLVNTGDVYMRLSESGIKAARLCFVFKLAW